MKKIVHIITGLGSGGAEHMLYKLLKYSNKDKYYYEVISLMDEGVYGRKIKSEGIKVHCLDINKKNTIKSLISATNICKDFHIVNTWLYHADIFGFIISKVILNKKLIWNIRHSNLDKDANKPTTLKIVKINSFLSRYVDCITYNSNKAFENHIRFGYSDNNSIIIPNGFELDKYKFSINSRVKIRKQLRIDEKEKIFITVGRWNIQKDYYTLLKAFNEVKKQNTNFKLIMCGNNLDYLNEELINIINAYNLRRNVILLGRREDIPELLSAADIYVSSSIGESFSNAIGEAMACELPCIVTDVGDSKIIVGDTGSVVKAKDYVALSEAILKYINELNLKDIGKKARERIEKNYDIIVIKKIFEHVYCKLLS